MKNSLFLLLLLILAGACNTDSTLDPIYRPSVKSGTNSLKAVKIQSLKKWGISQPTGLVKQGNTVVIGNRNGLYNAVSIDLNTREKKEVFRRGRARGEAVITTSLNSNGQSEVTALDIYNGMLLKTPAGSSMSNSTTMTSVNLPAGQQHLSAIQIGENIISTGLYEQGRYMFYSPLSRKAVYYLDYPVHPAFPQIQEQTKGILYASSILKARPDNQAFVCADMYSGMIDICRITTDNRIERIRQHIFHYPKVKIDEDRDFPDVAYSRDNHFGFTDISVSDDRIYAIYSGKTYRQDSEHFQECRTLMVLDWEGNILRTYRLDTPLTHIQYITDENVLYAITPDLFLVQVNL